MKSYLIVKCEPLENQYECDATRTPLYITEDWRNNAPECKFEVYEINENGCIGELIKEWDDPAYVEKGMVLGYWSADGEFIVEKKFINRKPADGIPAEIKIYLQSLGEYYDDDWEEYNSVCAYDCYDNEYVYGEFEGDEYPISH